MKKRFLFVLVFLLFITTSSNVYLAEGKNNEDYTTLFETKKIEDEENILKNAKQGTTDVDFKLFKSVKGLENQDYDVYETTQIVKQEKSKTTGKLKTTYSTNIIIEVKGNKSDTSLLRKTSNIDINTINSGLGKVLQNGTGYYAYKIINLATSNISHDYTDSGTSYYCYVNFYYEIIDNRFVKALQYTVKWRQYDSQFICTNIKTYVGAKGISYENPGSWVYSIVGVSDNFNINYPTSNQNYYYSTNWDHVSIVEEDTWNAMNGIFTIKRGTSTTVIELDAGFNSMYFLEFLGL